MYELHESMKEINLVWRVLNGLCHVREHDSCSTHIHIGTKNGWSLIDLKNIVKGWAWFEIEIVRAMPERRKSCVWTMPNFSHEYDLSLPTTKKLVRLHNTALEQQDFFFLFQFVDQSASIDELIDRAASKRLLYLNLKNTRINCNTVKIRSPPQSRNAKECKH